MHLHADRLHLSPSDVTAFLACEHLTTLSLAHASGQLERPEVEDEQRDLIFRSARARVRLPRAWWHRDFAATLDEISVARTPARTSSRRQSPLSYLNEIDRRTR